MSEGPQPPPEASPAPAAPSIYAGPTKRFFVSMLTRDIELKDAILDLLDNCVDGAMRQRRGSAMPALPYEGFWARIRANANGFEITDNCGGIPRDIAENSAFRLGRPDFDRDADLPTIGMYGIGMKRAIFKMGRDAKVISSPASGAFSVHYSPAWMDEDNENWDITIDDNEDALETPGTRIFISQLVSSVATQFGSDSPFVEELKSEIASYYGYIMQKGFSVYVNDEAVIPETLRLFAPDVAGDAGAITPYYFNATIDNINVTVYVGFRRPMPQEMEIEEEQDASRSREDAGITLICNDRVIVLNDRSRLTGWGDGNVPKYHNQFIAVGGHAMFDSKDASRLPLTTTKRGIDASTNVFLLARSYMIEGLKIATNYTYKWKGREEATEPYFRAARPMSVREFESRIASYTSNVRAIPGSRRLIPTLPVPTEANPSKRISFIRENDKIKSVARYLFDDASVRPSQVGEACFDRIEEEI